MYTIKQAAQRSGVSVQLLRAWERRYGVVTPMRTDSGYRLYDDAAIARLHAMRALVDEGWAPSTAAGRIRGMEDSAVAELSGQSGVLRAAAAPSIATPRRSLTEAFVAAAGDHDEAGVERVLDEMFATGSFEHVASDVVMPALVALGDAWAAGTIDVAAEHAAAGAVSRRLGMAFMAAGLPSQSDVVLIGLPPGARHDLGALAFATAARRSGLSVRYLGADLPASDWVDAVERTRARAVVIGVVMTRDAKPAQAVAAALRHAHPEVVIALGGRGAASLKLAELQPALILPPDLGPSVQALREALA